jgi:hypothetical protein
MDPIVFARRFPNAKMSKAAWKRVDQDTRGGNSSAFNLQQITPDGPVFLVAAVCDTEEDFLAMQQARWGSHSEVYEMPQSHALALIARRREQMRTMPKEGEAVRLIHHGEGAVMDPKGRMHPIPKPPPNS